MTMCGGERQDVLGEDHDIGGYLETAPCLFQFRHDQQV